MEELKKKDIIITNLQIELKKHKDAQLSSY